MEKTQKKPRQYSVEFKLCAILDKLENGLNYFETVRKHWNLSTTAEANKYANRLKLWERKYLDEVHPKSWTQLLRCTSKHKI